MIYGEDKIRHLARNTKSQRSANARSVKLLCNRQHRHAVNRQMRQIARDVELWHDHANAFLDTSDVGYIRDCRGGYHSAPIKRWAVNTARHITVQQRLVHLGSKLPDRISGHDATSWFAWDDAFCWAVHDLPSDGGGEAYRRKQLQQRKNMVRRTQLILELGLQQKLNAFMKQAHQPGPPNDEYGRVIWSAENPEDKPRLLLGRHDVEPFAVDVLRGKKQVDILRGRKRQDEEQRRKRWIFQHPEWKQALEQFCQRHNIN